MHWEQASSVEISAAPEKCMSVRAPLLNAHEMARGEWKRT